MQLKSISRELALLLLGQIKKNDINKINIESLLSKAIESLTQHWREQLDFCALKLEKANQELLDSELQEDAGVLKKSRTYLKTCLIDSENILNILSESIEDSIKSISQYNNSTCLCVGSLYLAGEVLNRN